jgi:pilus assembly protein CpaB
MGRQRSSGPLTSGRRIGIIIMVAGLVVAVLAAWLVFMVAQRSRPPAAAVQTVPQVFVVMAVQDVEPGRPIPADAVALKAFPKAFTPPGALATLEELTGKYATSRLTRDQIVLASQISATRPAIYLTDSIPVGKVALWMPLPALLAQADMLRAGDKVDVLLSLVPPAPPPVAGGAAEIRPANGLTTQTTLQNVELLFVGTPAGQAAPTEPGATSAPAGGATATGSAGQAQSAAPAVGATMVLVVVDPQDAVVAKFVKDSGGTVDFVMRSREPQNLPRTVAVNASTLDDRFTFTPR